VNTLHKLLFTGIGATLAAVGVSAILTKTHTGYVRFLGIRTASGDDAVWFGKACLLLAVLPLMVWLPARWVGIAITLWWLVLMAWLFLPFIFR